MVIIRKYTKEEKLLDIVHSTAVRTRRKRTLNGKLNLAITIQPLPPAVSTPCQEEMALTTVPPVAMDRGAAIAT